MNKKYHITDKGEVSLCKAEKQSCPYSKTGHFNTEKEAYKVYQKRMTDQTFIKKSKVYKNFNETNDSIFNNKEVFINCNINEAVSKFNNDIKGRSFKLKSENTGEPGIILEKLFGLKNDSSPGADLGTVELKTLKESSIGRNLSLGAIQMNSSVHFKNNFGFSGQLKAGEWIKQKDKYFALLVDRNSQKVRLVVANSNKEFISTKDYYWTFDSLKNKVDSKLENIAVALYKIDETEIDKTVTYTDIKTGGFSRNNFINKIESGEVRIEFRRGKAGSVFKAPLKSFIDIEKEL